VVDRIVSWWGLEVDTMKTFEFIGGSVEIDSDGDIWIMQDADRVVVDRTAFREFFAAVDAARDEVMPPAPIEIPDPARYDEARANVDKAMAEPADPDKIRSALGRLNLVIGNQIAPGAASAR
jgi:GT2 family glycosyltransferase